MILYNLRVRFLRLLCRGYLWFRPVPSRPNAPWTSLDAWAHGLVRIKGRWYDLGFEAPYACYADWKAEWDRFAVWADEYCSEYLSH